MYVSVENFVRSCEDCATAKGKPRYPGKSPGNLIASRPFQILATNFATPLPKTFAGNTAMLFFICLFTGFVVLVPMIDTSAASVAEAYLAGVLKRFGASEMIRHDRDPQSSTQANGKQEQSIRTVVKAIKCYVPDAKQQNWDEYVQQLELALNTSVNLTSTSKLVSTSSTVGTHEHSLKQSMLPPKNGGLEEQEALKWRLKI
ncbi:TPA: hypothetical protein N0F65_010784 [Lagenidium giganteum]|uniref:Integrase catalytic domain-containing protein n=1 Tax=Lagenidium giganteum TaxID=4803 RepID=A0AAV2YTD9_9STRA|nr:TPA: hypothetical protein N0F65_010784 [Lagenidium giganteum]